MRAWTGSPTSSRTRSDGPRAAAAPRDSRQSAASLCACVRVRSRGAGGSGSSFLTSCLPRAAGNQPGGGSERAPRPPSTSAACITTFALEGGVRGVTGAAGPRGFVLAEAVSSSGSGLCAPGDLL